MNEDYIAKALDEVSDEHITQALQAKRKRRRPLWIGTVAAALAVVLLVCALVGGPMQTTAYAISEARYPDMAPYPDMSAFEASDGEFDSDGYSRAFDAWWESRQALRNQPEGYASGLEDFFARSTRQFLTGGEENRVYSPLNVYMALAMLAELTDGNSRAQILSLLGAADLDALRAQATALWQANYCDDGVLTSILAGSVWLSQDVNFNQKTMDTLAQVYYASSYRGAMGSQDFNQALRDWLNTQTGGLLEEQASDLEMGPETILALAATVYFRGKWTDDFSKAMTEPSLFHTPSGDITCDFMHQSTARSFYRGEGFSAVAQGIENGGSMWLILPKAGVTPDALLAGSGLTDFLLSESSRQETSQYLTVNLALPKFDVSSDLELSGGLQALGVTDVFDSGVSDFSPMTEDTAGIYLSRVQHAARVTIDEEGLTAAAYTVMMTVGEGMAPEEEIDFTLDRPFLFAITNAEGLPLFVGVVNRPAA